MPVFRYQDLSHTDLASLPRDRTVVFLPSGPLEQHGPHLPLGVDAFSAEYFSEQLAERLAKSKPDWNFILFPTLFAGTDTLTYLGTIEVRPSVFKAILQDCCKQLARDGFRTLVAVSAHGGPRHMVVQEEVASYMRWRHRTRMISASSRILLEILEGRFVDKIAAKLDSMGKPLSATERDGLKCDYHGGLLETSIMMVAKPELVKPVYKELKPAILKSVWKMRRNSGKTVGEGLGHLGSPALARPEIGEAAVQVVLEDMLPLMERFIGGEKMDKFFRSKFYYIPFLRTDFKVILFLVVWFALLMVGFLAVNYFVLESFK